jgi:AraC-like DNA-binding protein
MTGGANSSPWPDGASAGYRFSTDDLPASDRLAIFREVVSLQMARLDMEPLPDTRLKVRGAVRAFPGQIVLWSESSPVRVGRTRPLLSDGDDSYMVQWATSTCAVECKGREATIQAGDAVLMTCSEVTGMVLPSPFETVTLKIPRNALGRSAPDADAWLVRPIPGDSGALKLLFGYLTMLRGATATSELQQLAVTHVCDLLAVALGATRDARDTARGRGLRAARMAAIKAYIGKHLTDESLSVETAACSQRMTPRSVQMLFEREGTTFTEFVCEQRLAGAHRMLVSRRFDNRQIADIALACGFGDVSHFNRQFRAHYGATPSDVRNGRSQN